MVEVKVKVKVDIEVNPYKLLEHVVRYHSKDVRELDLSFVPFNSDTCESPGRLPQLLRQVFKRCTRLERFTHAT
jgi:hypothetical protein